MNAPNPLSPDKRGADSKTYEPSMEEILASIRRIIADDQAFRRPAAPVPDMASREEPPASPVTEAAESEPEPRPHFAQMDVPKSAAELAAAAEPESAPPAMSSLAPPNTAPFPVEAKFEFFKSAAVSRRVEPVPSELTSAEQKSETVHIIKPSLEVKPELEPALEADQLPPPPPAAALPEARAEREPPLVSPATDAAVSSAFTALAASHAMPPREELNAMVREMLRPMLKAWLDDNLPVLVERLVRAEIERVARGGH